MHTRERRSLAGRLGFAEHQRAVRARRLRQKEIQESEFRSQKNEMDPTAKILNSDFWLLNSSSNGDGLPPARSALPDRHADRSWLACRPGGGGSHNVADCGGENAV